MSYSETTRRRSVRLSRDKLRATATLLGPAADAHVPGLRAALTSGLTVFVYHEITGSPSEFQRISASFTAPDLFECQIGWLAERFVFIKPTDLPQLGSTDPLPANAALLTFDDAWAGVFRTGLPLLSKLGIPAVCCLNMATVAGAPDLAAARRYAQITRRELVPGDDGRLDAEGAREVVKRLHASYGEDRDFLRFQGETATAEDLAATDSSAGRVWLVSHLYHHWDLTTISTPVFAQSARDNAAALATYPNALPAMLATPYGRRIRWSPELEALGLRVILIATGGQNRNGAERVLDRLQLGHNGDHRTWWWSVHRRRLFGRLAS